MPNLCLKAVRIGSVGFMLCKCEYLWCVCDVFVKLYNLVTWYIHVDTARWEVSEMARDIKMWWDYYNQIYQWGVYAQWCYGAGI